MKESKDICPPLINLLERVDGLSARKTRRPLSASLITHLRTELVGTEDHPKNVEFVSK